MFDLEGIQEDVERWTRYNFGEQPIHQPMMGVMEELGELSHEILKRQQGIRGKEDNTAEIKDAIGDMCIYLMNVCNVASREYGESFVLEEIIDETWEQVRKRNWVDNPKDGINE